MTQEEKNNMVVQKWEELVCALSAAGYTTDPRKFREVVASIQTGCRPSKKKSGADCYYGNPGPKEKKAERKSTFDSTIKGSYTGVSKFQTWKEQEEHLEEKIKGVDRHYFDKFCRHTGILLESYYLSSDKIYDIVMPQVKKQFEDTSPKKDPRPSGTVNMTIIKKYGVKVF